MRACAGTFNVASLRNVGLLGSKSGLGSTGGVCREGLLEGTCLNETGREGGASPSLGFPGGKARHWNLSTLPPSPPPPPDCCLPSWRLRAAGSWTDRETAHTQTGSPAQSPSVSP